MATLLEYVEERHRYKVLYNGRLLAAYNKGDPKYGDFFKSRPDVEPVYSLSGLPVTTTGASNFNHHKSLFWGLGTLNGHNFFHDNYPPVGSYGKMPPGDVLLTDAEVSTGDGAVTLDTVNAWVSRVHIADDISPLFKDPGPGHQLGAERRTVGFTLGDGYYTIDSTSVFEASEGDLHFGEDSHAFFGARVADAIDEEDGGVVTDSDGRTGADEIYDTVVPWVDYSGQYGDQSVGIAIMVHPFNPLPEYFRTRAYGLLLPCPFYHTDYLLPEGESITFRHRAVIHDGDISAVDLAGLYAEMAAD